MLGMLEAKKARAVWWVRCSSALQCSVDRGAEEEERNFGD